MTYEEAIKYLIAPVATSTEPSAEYLKQKEAYDLAIQALETGEVYMTGVDYNLYIEGYKAGKRDFKPKQSEWIFNTSFWSCSVCKSSAKTIGYCGDAKFMNEFFRYCPNCGADMKKGGDKNV